MSKSTAIALNVQRKRETNVFREALEIIATTVILPHEETRPELLLARVSGLVQVAITALNKAYREEEE